MSHSITTRRLVGERIARFELRSLAHGALTIPAPGGFAHLSFRRFAGCPVCNLHLRSLARQHERLLAHGVRTIAFFHSDADSMRPYQGDLPFPTVADPERHYYRAFGVERSLAATLHPRAMRAVVAGLATLGRAPWAGGPDPTGLPADFLIAEDGTLTALHYGKHADDQWTVEDILERASVPTRLAEPTISRV
jgi:peroxiredoxin